MTNLALTDRDGRPPPTNRGADRRHEFELEGRGDPPMMKRRSWKAKTGEHSSLSGLLDNLTMEKATTLLMSPDFEVVDVNDYDIVLTDIKGETIRTLEIDGSTHLSEAQTSIEQVSVSLNGVTYGDYSRVLVRAVLSAKQKSVNAIMLVDTGSPYTFLTDETFKALGINLEEQPSDQAFIVLVNAQRTKAHLSKAHFEEVNVLGTNFLDFCELQVNYPKKTARITIVPV